MILDAFHFAHKNFCVLTTQNFNTYVTTLYFETKSSVTLIFAKFYGIVVEYTNILGSDFLRNKSCRKISLVVFIKMFEA